MEQSSAEPPPSGTATEPTLNLSAECRATLAELSKKMVAAIMLDPKAVQNAPEALGHSLAEQLAPHLPKAAKCFEEAFKKRSI